MIDPFLVRAFLAAIGLAIVAAPLGCIVVWNRMSYFGETMANAGLVGVALGLAFRLDLTLSVMIATLFAALVLIGLSRQKIVPIDSVLGLMHYGALALGVMAIAGLKGQSIDIVGYLFGDIFAVSYRDLWWIVAITIVVFAAMVWLWQPLVRLAVHEDLAQAEGMSAVAVKSAFTILLAVVIAVAIKIVGILLAIAFLIVPVVAARPFARDPETMAIISAVIGVLCAVGGLLLSMHFDVPGGPAIVLLMTMIAGVALVHASLKA